MSGENKRLWQTLDIWANFWHKKLIVNSIQGIKLLKICKPRAFYLPYTSPNMA